MYIHVYVSKVRLWILHVLVCFAYIVLCTLSLVSAYDCTVYCIVVLSFLRSLTFAFFEDGHWRVKFAYHEKWHTVR